MSHRGATVAGQEIHMYGTHSAPRPGAAGWSALLARIAGGAPVYLVVTALPIRLLPFSPATQWLSMRLAVFTVSPQGS